jgi:ATP-binding cassette subfamily A (ABC1) protein 3
MINRPVALKMKSLSKLYGSLRAVDSLNFNIYKNEVFTLLGHNGAGKTTAISMLTGMVQPSRGDAEIMGRSLVNEINAVRQEIGLC